MPDNDDVSEQFAGLVSVVVSLILVLERTGVLNPRDLAAELRGAYAELDAVTRKAQWAASWLTRLVFLIRPIRRIHRRARVGFGG